MKRLIILLLIIGSGIAFYVFADLESMSSAILSMPPEALIALAVLLMVNETIKGFRWAFFLRASRLNIRTLDGVTSYLAAQSATALPGGAVLSARLAQEHGHVRMHQAAASLVGQGIADAFALAFVSGVGILVTGQRFAQLLVPLLAFLGALTVVTAIRNQRLALWLTSFFKRFRLTRRFLPEEEDFREHTVVLMTFRILTIGACFSILTTVMGAAILMTIATALTERGISTGEALYAHSLSTVARVVIPTPGGIGVSDGSLAGLLNFIGIGLARATFVALGYRSVGLLFRTLIGFLVLIARYPHLLVGPLRMDRGRPALVRGRRPAIARTTATAQPVRGDSASVETAASSGNADTAEPDFQSVPPHRRPTSE